MDRQQRLAASFPCLPLSTSQRVQPQPIVRSGSRIDEIFNETSPCKVWSDRSRPAGGRLGCCKRSVLRRSLVGFLLAFVSLARTNVRMTPAIRGATPESKAMSPGLIHPAHASHLPHPDTTGSAHKTTNKRLLLAPAASSLHRVCDTPPPPRPPCMPAPRHVARTRLPRPPPPPAHPQLPPTITKEDGSNNSRGGSHGLCPLQLRVAAAALLVAGASGGGEGSLAAHLPDTPVARVFLWIAVICLVLLSGTLCDGRGGTVAGWWLV